MTPGQLQAGLALGAALALHLAAFSLAPDTGGAAASGDGGASLVSLEAAAPSVAAMVAAWDRPPAAMQAPPPAMATPAAPDAALSLPAPAAPPVSPVAVPRPALTPPVDVPPVAEAAPAAPPPPSAPQTDALADPPPAVRPKARPDQRAEPRPPAERATAARTTTPAPGQAAQRAAGSGDGERAGSTGEAEAATLSQAAMHDLRAAWGAKIRARIEGRKRYPAGAGRVSGTVTLRLTVSRTGVLEAVSVATSSGHAALDEAALRAVRAAGRFSAAPEALGQASYSFTLPMTFAR